jgi:hypothetical protein
MGLTTHGKRILTNAKYARGINFVAAALLLRKHGGDRYVVLHLLCQGLEIIVKALLLFLDHKKYAKLQKSFGHDLEKIISAAIIIYSLGPLRPPLAAEITALNDFYSRHLLRYGGLHDIFGASLGSARTFRRLAAVVRLANRELAKLKS